MKEAGRSVWLPSLFVGAAAAVAVATAAAVLLYESAGLFRAASVLGAVAVFSLSAGLWTGTVHHESESIPSAAKWWIAYLVALLLGAGFAGLWEAFDGLRGTPVSQGVGLAMTTALPAYFAGGVWGRIGSFAGSVGSGLVRRVAFGAACGVAVGTVLVLTILARPVLAVTAFLGAAIFASLGARIQGWIFDRIPHRRDVMRVPERPELRFESWHVTVPASTWGILFDSGVDVSADPVRPGGWREGVAGTLREDDEVLFLGAGAWFPMESGRKWWIDEPDPDIRELAARGFGWADSCLWDGSLRERKGITAVVELRELNRRVAQSGSVTPFLHEMRSMGARCVWIGGPLSRVRDDLITAARGVGFEVAQYTGSLSRSGAPPHLPARTERLWCLDSAGEPPVSVGDLRPVPMDRPAQGAP